MRTQIASNVSQRTFDQAHELRDKLDYSMRDVLSIAIDRLYHQEIEMKEMSDTNNVRAEAERLLRDEPNSEIVLEAHRRASEPHPYGLPKSVLSELCFLLWAQARMPLHDSEIAQAQSGAVK